jgi:hypothetical protein
VCYNAHKVPRKLILSIVPGVLGLTAAVLAAWCVLRSGGDESATLLAEQGEATVRRGGTTFSSSTGGTFDVRSGDQINTLADSRILLIPSPGAFARLESDCEVVLSHLAMSGTGSFTMGLRVERGDTSYQALGSAGVESRYEILTPAAVVMVASGRCRIRVLEDGETTVEVSEGVADVLAKDTTVTVSPGEYTSVVPGRAPAVPRPMVARYVFVSKRAGNPDIWLLDEQGRETQLTFDAASDLAPVWSPDGARIAFETDRDRNSEIYVMEADGSNPVNLTRNRADDRAPAWSLDGASIAFQSDRDGTSEVYLMNADGAEQIRETSGPGPCLAPQWEPDGSGIVFSRIEGDTSGDGLLDARDMSAPLVLPLDGSSPRVLWRTGEVFDQMVFPWAQRAVR